ncbi:hypothetical protein DdX_08413 [Ditylenchus destructor]|uniref:Ground-like domain-containing protein n=1 Tax=Ditylenchus destructor TaxID=166010 RepID=A0AAD4R6U7_9BILA|nr:hypothetical protein DdX_08413 [Ditylenchus destructor]
MHQRSACLLAIAAILVLMELISVDGCGFPMPAPPPPPMPCESCCCGGGRKKREAVTPIFKSEDTPCPQAEWKSVIEESISKDDASTSVNSIQTAFYRKYANTKFLVTCASNKSNEAANLPAKVHLSSSGDGYCNVVNERIWCQVVSLSA